MGRPLNNKVPQMHMCTMPFVKENQGIWLFSKKRQVTFMETTCAPNNSLGTSLKMAEHLW